MVGISTPSPSVKRSLLTLAKRGARSDTFGDERDTEGEEGNSRNQSRVIQWITRDAGHSFLTN